MRIPSSPRFRFAVTGTLLLALGACNGGVGPETRMRSSNGLAAPAPRVAKHSEALDHSKNFEVHGIDVSKYQGEIDWYAVADSGTSFAFIKATEGGDVADAKFAQNWAGARAAGIPRGAYHFAYWCRPWQEEMSWFERNVPVEADALPPVLDVEATPESRSCKKVLYPEETVATMRNMLERMERHFGKRPIIYSTVDFYEAILSTGALSEFPIWGALDETPSVRALWHAQVAFLAVPVRWHGRRHPDGRRSQCFSRIGRESGSAGWRRSAVERRLLKGRSAHSTALIERRRRKRAAIRIERSAACARPHHADHIAGR